MATSSMDKALYQAPMGLSDMGAQPDIEVEIEDPESLSIRMGDIEIEFEAGPADITEIAEAFGVDGGGPEVFAGALFAKGFAAAVEIDIAAVDADGDAVFLRSEGDGFDGELAALANFDALGLDVLPAGIPGVGVKKKGELIEKGLDGHRL